MAALDYEQSADAALFEAVHWRSQEDEAERVTRVRAAVNLMREAEASARHATETASRLVQTAEAARRAPGLSYPGLYLPLDLSYPGLSKVCEKPPIFVCEDFLSAAECEQLIKVSGPLLQRSKTHAAAGSEATNGRTSLTCHLAKKTAPCPAILAKSE